MLEATVISTAKRTAKRTNGVVTPKPRKLSRRETDNLCRYAHSVVFLSAGLSMLLNSLANATHASPDSKVLAYGMGAMIPILVLLLGRVSGLLYRRKKVNLAYTIGGIASVLLLLSVFHCAESIMALTGSNWVIAGALAIGIDCGLIACEVVTVLED